MHTFLFKFRVTLTLAYIFKGKYGVEIEKSVYPVYVFVKSYISLCQEERVGRGFVEGGTGTIGGGGGVESDWEGEGVSVGNV